MMELHGTIATNVKRRKGEEIVWIYISRQYISLVMQDG